MTAEELLRDGDLQSALARLQQQIKANPAVSAPRIFLFQLLVVLQEWDKALNQLDVLAQLDHATLAMANAYRQAIVGEKQRNNVFAGRQLPVVFGQPQQATALFLQALKLSINGEEPQAASLRAEALAQLNPTSGRLDGAPFQWIADGDSRIGPFLEAIVGGHYYWIPFENICRIQLEEPADLRDLVWAPAQFTWSNGGGSVGFIPVRYAGISKEADADFLLARKTDWFKQDDDNWRGAGQRMLMTDQDDFSLLNIRDIALNTVAIDARMEENPPDASAMDRTE